MRNIITLIFAFFIFHASAQKNKQLSIAFVNASTATPFSHFGSLLTRMHQPGIEVGYLFNWKTKTKHDWYQELKFGYIYHRFVQHSIPFYTDFGYRYKFNKKWKAQSGIGLGYLHSIPATAQHQLESNGEYKNAKGIGRMQGLATFNISVLHVINPEATKRKTIFITWQQMIQTPFINSYVPLLPYNSLLLGISVPFKTKK